MSEDLDSKKSPEKPKRDTISRERCIQIMDFAITKGKVATLEAFKLSDETFNRYKREAKKYYGESLDLIIQMKESYTDIELKAIANGGRIVPGYSKTPIVDFNGDTVTFGVMSDNHIGSMFSNPQDTLSALEEMNKQGCDFIVHSGDIVEGMMGRPGDIYELSQIGYKAQRDEAVRIFNNWKKPFYTIVGNHDASYNSKLGAGVNIVEDICSSIGSNFHCLGFNDGDLSIKGTVIKLWHGGDGASYAIGYREQKIVESFTGGEKPNVLITGHTHKAQYFMYRNVHVIGAGTLQKQSSWMRSKKLAAHIGFWIIKMCIAEGKVKWIEPRWYPYYI